MNVKMLYRAVGVHPLLERSFNRERRLKRVKLRSGKAETLGNSGRESHMWALEWTSILMCFNDPLRKALCESCTAYLHITTFRSFLGVCMTIVFWMFYIFKGWRMKSDHTESLNHQLQWSYPHFWVNLTKKCKIVFLPKIKKKNSVLSTIKCPCQTAITGMFKKASLIQKWNDLPSKISSNMYLQLYFTNEREHMVMKSP